MTSWCGKYEVDDQWMSDWVRRGHLELRRYMQKHSRYEAHYEATRHASTFTLGGRAR